MTAKYLFNSTGLVKFASYVTPDTLFAFDLDGTVAQIVENFSAARVDDAMRDALQRLDNLATVIVITGRSRKDALAMLGFEPHLLIGNHGAEWPAHGANRDWQQIRICLKWQEQLLEMLSYLQGVEFEFKGETVSIHYRKVEEQEQILPLIKIAIDKLEPPPRRIGGKYVVNLLPVEALTKGEALVKALKEFGLKRAIYFGDDVTDEEVFRLRSVDLFGVHIGQELDTAAPFYLKGQAELLGLLNSMVGLLEHPLNEQG